MAKPRTIHNTWLAEENAIETPIVLAADRSEDRDAGAAVVDEADEETRTPWWREPRGLRNRVEITSETAG